MSWSRRNLSQLGSDAGITHNTAKSWLGVLEASYLVTRIAPFLMIDRGTDIIAVEAKSGRTVRAAPSPTWPWIPSTGQARTVEP